LNTVDVDKHILEILHTVFTVRPKNVKSSFVNGHVVLAAKILSKAVGLGNEYANETNNIV
jgi:hypothetical protein